MFFLFCCLKILLVRAGKASRVILRVRPLEAETVKPTLCDEQRMSIAFNLTM